MEMDEFDAVGRFGKSPGGAVGLTVVVEFESGGEGGAFEMGTALEGSPELGRLVSDACDEADALVGDGGGWAAVRIGSATWRASTARAAGPCTLPKRGEAYTESAGMPSACPRQLFRGCLAPSPSPCAPRGGAPWNLG